MFDHLGVIDEADELPFSKMDDPLRHIHSHVDNNNFFVHGTPALVGQQWIVDDVRLWTRLLWVVIGSIVFVAFKLTAD